MALSCSQLRARAVSNLGERRAAWPRTRLCTRPARSLATAVRAASDFQNPVRQTIANIVTGIYKASAGVTSVEPGLSPMWTAVKKLDLQGVKVAISQGLDLNERDANGDTPLLYIARAGHYKYPPREIPAALLEAGADKEARDKAGLTALQVSLLAGWQNISELLIKAGADTSGVRSIVPRLTCPDCKRIVAEYKLA
ncbi:ankyrin repeat-containing domain protein, partial [Haematococcus lacustris]